MLRNSNLLLIIILIFNLIIPWALSAKQKKEEGEESLTESKVPQNAQHNEESENEHDETKAAREEKRQKRPSRILVAYASDSKSHLRSMLPLINSSDTKGERFAPNVSLIPVPIVQGNVDRMKGIGEQIWKSTLHAWGLPMIYKLIGHNFEELMELQADKLTQMINARWDLVLISDLFSPHAYAFCQVLSEKFGVPYVVFSSSMVMSSTAFALAMGHSWVTHPHPFSPTPQHLKDGFDPAKFGTRLTNLFEHISDVVSHSLIENVIIGPGIAKFTGGSPTEFSFQRLYARSSLSTQDSIDLLALPQPNVRELLSAGAHCEKPSELSEDYRLFMEDPASKGTIYIAFGTFIPWDFAPPHVINAFFDALERLPDYRVIFSYRGKPPQRKLASHIRLVDWAPQLDILSHPNTKVFLTHSGLKSVKESLCSSTPMLAMPIFAEQNHNAMLVVESGIGVALNKYAIDTEQIYGGLRELLDNPAYADRVAKMQSMFLDRPMPVLDEAEFLVRRIIEKGPIGKERKTRLVERKGARMTLFSSAFLDWALLTTLFVLLLSK